EGARLDRQRLETEVALLADRADVTEELTRLGAHLDELGHLVDSDGSLGRRLDFLTQELHREVNTIGSKSQSAAIARAVIDAKTEVERLREQVR
ncbi:endoribonuclease YicC domain-containing protein, partial [Escherichia coli]